jgi:hypothetical protein
MKGKVQISRGVWGMYFRTRRYQKRTERHYKEKNASAQDPMEILQKMKPTKVLFFAREFYSIANFFDSFLVDSRRTRFWNTG